MVTDTAPYMDGHPTFMQRENLWLSLRDDAKDSHLFVFVNIYLVFPLYYFSQPIETFIVLWLFYIGGN